MRHVIAAFAFLVLSCAAVAQSSGAPAVKKSEQGICHARGSATYKRTKHFEPYDTMDACLASGGRLAKNAAVEGAEDEGSGGSGSGWLSGLGGKIAMIVGMLVVVAGAFLLSRRRSAAALRGAAQDDLERKRWEGNRRE